jgi:hypothetical protein
MALIVKPLYAANVGVTTTSILYAPSAGRSALVTSVRLVNNGPNSAQVNLLVQPSASAQSWQITKKDYPLAVGAAMVMQDPLTLGAGDRLQILVTGTSPSIASTVFGAERQ